MRLDVVLGPKAEVPLSDEQREELGGGVRIPVAGTINGTPFTTTVFRMHAFTGIAFRQDLQRRAGVVPGDRVVLDLERDTQDGRGAGRPRGRSGRRPGGAGGLRSAVVHPPQGVRRVDHRGQAAGDP